MRKRYRRFISLKYDKYEDVLKIDDIEIYGTEKETILNALGHRCDH